MKVSLFILLISATWFCSCAGTNKTPASEIQGDTTSLSAAYNYAITENNDTIQSVRLIYKNKENYIHQPFSKLLKDFKYPVAFYTPGSNFYDVKQTPNITIYFRKTNLRFTPTQRPFALVISWDSPASSDTVWSMGKKTKGVWTDLENDYFGKMKIKDIIWPQWVSKN